MQNDIINPSYTLFTESIQPSLEKRTAVSSDSSQSTGLDFEQIQKAHKAYLERLVRGCLLESAGCAQIISNVFQICLDYCELIQEVGEKGNWSGRRKSQTGAEIVAKWTHGFGQEQDPLAWVGDVLTIEKVRGCSGQGAGGNRRLMCFCVLTLGICGRDSLVLQDPVKSRYIAWKQSRV
jgi:hypothetical protein